MQQDKVCLQDAKRKTLKQCSMHIYVAMLLDPEFKKAPMLTAEKKASIISFIKYKLEVCVLDDQ